MLLKSEVCGVASDLEPVEPRAYGAGLGVVLVSGIAACRIGVVLRDDVREHGSQREIDKRPERSDVSWVQ